MSAPERLPQQDFLLKILRYDPDSGKLFWHKYGTRDQTHETVDAPPNANSDAITNR